MSALAHTLTVAAFLAAPYATLATIEAVAFRLHVRGLQRPTCMVNRMGRGKRP